MTETTYECWQDPADGGLTVTTRDTVNAYRATGQLSDAAVLLYTITTCSWEEAMAIHALRQGWAPYVPQGEASRCPRCAATYYPEGSGDCWRCGKIA